MKNILFLCIGNSNIIGDSLGPLIGSFLKYYNNVTEDAKLDVQGTMEEPIGYKKINNIFMEQEYSNIIIIDSALGNEKNIGKILIDNSSLYAGKGVNRGKEIYGDIVIRGIVAKNHNDVQENIRELSKVKSNIIEEMASKIVTTIIPTLIFWSRYKIFFSGNNSYIR